MSSPRICALEDDESTEVGGLDYDARHVKVQLDKATWQLEPKDLARALSAKKHRDAEDKSFEVHNAQDNYNVELDRFDEATVNSLAQEPPSTINDFTSFAKYFNDLVKSCQKLSGHSYANPYFHMPDSHSSSSIDQIDLPVETQDDLSTLIIRAGARAVTLFQSEPLRNFALVLGYNHNEHALRFLVYHRSGLTMSPSLKADSFEGRENIVWLVLSLCTWRTRSDAGMPEWCLDSHLYLPGDATGTLYEIKEVLRSGKSIRVKTPCVWRISPVQATQIDTTASLIGHPAMFLDSPFSLAGTGEFDNDLVLKFSCVSGNPIPEESEVLQSCGRKFGVVKHFASFPVFLAPGILASNHAFLPLNAIPFFSNGSDDQRKPSCSLWCHVTSYAGDSFSTARNVKEWLRGIACALIGYYVLILNGIQHRDISISNICLERSQAVGSEQLMDTFRNADISDEQLNKLEELIEKLEITNGCTGRVIDLGMAINFKGLNYEDLDSACHGTTPFISRELLIASLLEEKYVQSPVDDLFSFLHTAHWSAAYNGDPEGKGPIPQMLNQTYNKRTEALCIFGWTLKHLRATEFLITCQPFLTKWLGRLLSLHVRSEKICAENPLEEAFKQLTYLGVVDAFECMLSFVRELNNRDSLVDTPSCSEYSIM